MKRLFVFTFILGFMFMSCKKDKDKSCELSEQNIQGSYKLTSFKYKASSTTPEIDALNTILEPCKRDDIVILLPNKTYQYKDAGTQCQPNGDVEGKWSLSGNSLILGSEVANVESFSCSGFTISTKDSYQDGDKTTATYQKQ